MKTILLTLVLFIAASNSMGQTASDTTCSAFFEGCWTLIGASDGVELYVTYKRNARPGITTPYTFNITVYAKLVNTNQTPFSTVSAPSADFYFYDPKAKLMTFKSISMPQRIEKKQTIIKYMQIATDTDSIHFSQIRSFVFVPA